MSIFYQNYWYFLWCLFGIIFLGILFLSFCQAYKRHQRQHTRISVSHTGGNQQRITTIHQTTCGNTTQGVAPPPYSTVVNPAYPPNTTPVYPPNQNPAYPPPPYNPPPYNPPPYNPPQGQPTIAYGPNATLPQ